MVIKRVFPKEIEYKFKKLSDYKIIHTDGIWGGITKDGLIRMDLFAESTIIESIKHEIQNGELTREISRTPKVGNEKVTVQRDLQIGTIMTPKTARAISEWLEKQCDEIEGKNK